MDEESGDRGGGEEDEEEENIQHEEIWTKERVGFFDYDTLKVPSDILIIIEEGAWSCCDL